MLMFVVYSFPARLQDSEGLRKGLSLVRHQVDRAVGYYRIAAAQPQLRATRDLLQLPLMIADHPCNITV